MARRISPTVHKFQCVLSCAANSCLFSKTWVIHKMIILRIEWKGVQSTYHIPAAVEMLRKYQSFLCQQVFLSFFFIPEFELGSFGFISGYEAHVNVCFLQVLEESCRWLWLCVLSCSVVSDSLWPPWTVAHQAPLSVEFSSQEYSSGLPFPPPGDLPDSGIKPTCPASPALAVCCFREA